MPIIFQKPIGAHADLRELEYVSALHQTGATLRRDGSVTVEDVVALLASRHGIKADVDYVKQHLMPDLAGALSADKDQEPIFDIVELVSMLLIPYLRKEAVGEANKGLFHKVVDMIVLDSTGSHDPIQLNRETMKLILETYGEEDVSDEVIDEMLLAAGVKESAEFDADKLIQATVGDTSQYMLDWENRPSTHYHDALEGTTLELQDKNEESDEEILSGSILDDKKVEIRRIRTFPTIDFVAENYRSKAFVVLVLIMMIIGFFVYALAFQTALGQQDCSSKFKTEFGCRVVNSIISWLIIFAQLSILGTLFVSCTSAGNSIYLQQNLSSIVAILVGMASLVVAAILSFAFEIKFLLIDTTKSDGGPDMFGYYFFLILGCFLMLFQLKALAYVILPRSLWKRIPFKDFFLTSGTSKAERSTKQAAAFKTSRMVENALIHHASGTFRNSMRTTFKSITSSRVAYGAALLHYDATSDLREPRGGIISTYRNMINGKLFSEEGIWVHARLYATNLSQWFIALFYLILYAFFAGVVADLFDATPTTSAPTTSAPPSASPAPSYVFDTAYLASLLAPTYVQAMSDILSYGDEFVAALWQQISEEYPELVGNFSLGILNSTTPDIVAFLAQQARPEIVQDFVKSALERIDIGSIVNVTNLCGNLGVSTTGQRFLEDAVTDAPVDTGDSTSFDPTRPQVMFAVTMGGLAAFLSTVALAIVWIPSSVSTIEQFRCGVLRSLHDAEFEKYRVAPDLTTIIFGSAFWGTFYSSGVLFGIVGGLSFLLVWEATRSVVVALLAQIIGIFVTIGFKILLMIFIRKVLFVGFFRVRPAGGNLLLLIFECWSLGLTIGTMSIRMIKLVLISAFYIGRLDTPVFAQGVGDIGPIPLDSHPIQFRKDLLLHEAHRHPYIERLSTIYILKLRYGGDFGSRAGGAWRLIFVMAMMPWLRRFRLDEGSGSSSLEKGVDDEGETTVVDNELAPKALMLTSLEDANGTERYAMDDQVATLRGILKQMQEQMGNDRAKVAIEGAIQDVMVEFEA